MANTYSAPHAKIAENRSQPKSDWGRDLGSRPGRPDFRAHAANGKPSDYEARKWGSDPGVAAKLYRGED